MLASCLHSGRSEAWSCPTIQVANYRGGSAYARARKHEFVDDQLQKLQLLVHFSLQFFIKLDFDIKIKWHLINGALHVLTLLQILHTLPEKVQNIVGSLL